MAKLITTDLANLQNETTAVTAINANNTAIENAMENTFSRDGTSPNAMAANLDMNSNRILNLPAAVDDTEPVRLGDTGITALGVAVTSASASAAAASSSASSASSSASSASSSATTAATAASNASTSATNAATSATQAAAAVAAVAFRYVWSTNTSNTDPTTGKIKVNNASPGSATALYISETDADGNSLGSEIARWDDSVSAAGRARVNIAKNGTNFLLTTITSAVTDNGAWDAFTIANGTMIGSLANGDSVYVDVTTSGADGAVSGPGSSTDNAVVRWDGTTGAVIQNSAVTIADTTGLIAGARFGNTGLNIEDTDASNLLNIKPGSNLTADRILTLTTGDAARNLTITADSSIGGTALITANNLSDVTAATAFGNIKQTATQSATGVVELATSAEYITGTDTARVPAVDQIWAAAVPGTIADSATYTPNFSTNIDIVATLGATCGATGTFANPTSPKAGQKGIIYFVQDATGSRKINTWGTQYKFSGGTKPSFSTAANAIDAMSYACKSTTEIHCFFSNGMS